MNIRLSTSILIVMSSVAIAGCQSVSSGLKKAVQMEYDQRQNFSQFEFQNQISIGFGQIINHISANGFWASFVLCSVRNTGADAQPFPYDVHKFYVDIDGQKFFYRQLQADQWPHEDWVSNSVVAIPFESETLTSPKTHTFPVGYNSSVGYRVVIFVPAGAADNIDPLRLTLRYDGYPNFTLSRNHAATQLTSNPPNYPEQEDLSTYCRSPAQ
jgi:hypothetical protein